MYGKTPINKSASLIVSQAGCRNSVIMSSKNELWERICVLGKRKRLLKKESARLGDNILALQRELSTLKKQEKLENKRDCYEKWKAEGFPKYIDGVLVGVYSDEKETGMFKEG